MTMLRPPGALRWWTLAVVSVGTFMLMLDLSVVAVALPGIRGDLHASFSEMQWVFDAYALTLAAFLVISGSIADRRGRRAVFVVGLVVFTVASLACGLADSIEVLNISRGVQGVGAAIMFAVGPALLGHEFHGKERAAAFSVFGAAVGIAAATGPLIGGALTSGPGWRWIFFLNVPVGLATLLVALRRLRESRLAHSAAPDFAGMAAFTVALGALVLAIVRGNTDGWFSGSNIALYAVAGVGLVVFLALSRARGENAMMDLRMFRNRTFVALCAVTFLANAAGFPAIFIETSYLQSVLSNSAWEAGLRFLPLSLGMFVFGALTGAMTNKVPFRIIMGVSQLALAVALLLTHRGGPGDAWTALLPSLVVMGAAFGLFQPTRAALAIGVAEPAKAGVASGINETFQQVGVALGIAVAGAFFENRVADSFARSDAAASIGDKSHEVASAISAGAIEPAARSAGPALRDQVLADGRHAFTEGFHQAMTLCAAMAFTAAVIAFAFLRNKDLHESALTGVPPELPAEDDAAAERSDSGTHRPS
ncbi:MFS transporter [Streptomyces sp. NPDC016845]|uniref:MFS transporter n=1 Tax=Streptomyces sp. NPDC016845 TaxID=3364972 RepID=UPI00379D9700